jgi:hypothetical protein
MSDGQWYVRFAGRVTGPFDLDRVRTMARRGAITRMHFLSKDGKSWVAASRVPAVFEDESPAIVPDPPRAVPQVALEPQAADAPRGGPAHPAMPAPGANPPPAALPTLMAMVPVDPVKLAAVSLGLAAAAVGTPDLMPIADPSAWTEPNRDSLRVVVRAAQVLAVPVGGYVCILAPARGIAAALSGVALAISIASAVDTMDLRWAPWALGLAIVASVLCASTQIGGPLRRPAALSAALIAPVVAATGIVLLLRDPGTGPDEQRVVPFLLGAGGLAIAAAATFTLVRHADGHRLAVPVSVLGATLAVASVLVAAWMRGPGPASRAIAVDACFALAASWAAWAGILGVFAASAQAPRPRRRAVPAN